MEATTGGGAGAGAAKRYFESRRSIIVDALDGLAARHGSESLSRIAEFCRRGKMIRGGLAFLGAEAARGSAPAAVGGEPALARLALAMELFQAGLLAHDDIMDRDLTRRGAPTIHARYAKEYEELGVEDCLHVGEALGICLGDVCYFEGFAEFSAAFEGRPRAAEAQALCASVLSEVALAQMKDVGWGSTRAEPSEAEILDMYRSKTARYTFSLPLAAGSLLAGSAGPAGDGLAASLSALGERLGILFQLRDDELGLFGEQLSTGKGRGSDLREGKKTLLRSRMLAAAPREELPRLAALFGGGASATQGDIEYIRRLSEELGVARSIRELSGKAEEEALAMIRALPGLAPETAGVLEGLVEYVTKRNG